MELSPPDLFLGAEAPAVLPDASAEDGSDWVDSMVSVT